MSKRVSDKDAKNLVCSCKEFCTWCGYCKTSFTAKIRSVDCAIHGGGKREATAVYCPFCNH